MSDRLNLNEENFDEAFKNLIPDTPPENILANVLPCRRAMNYIIAGFALSAIRLNMLWLQFILPTLGFIFLLIGFRALSRENSWFRLCKGAAIVLNAMNIIGLGLNATIYCESFTASPYGKALVVVNVAVIVLFLIFFAEGLRELQAKAGVKPRTGSLIMMILWYMAAGFLGLVEAEIGFIGLIFLIMYPLFLISLNKTAKILYKSGYAIETQPPKVSDKWTGIIVLAAAFITIVFGLTFFSRFPMDFAPIPENEHSEVEEIKAELLDLGFPENVLNDLSAEDIKACEGALDLIVKSDKHAMNNGRRVAEQVGSTTIYKKVYDVEELASTEILLKLPGDKEETNRWRVFHYFCWETDPGFLGTDMLELSTPENENVNLVTALVTSDFTGRVMYNKDGEDYSAPYYSVWEKIIPDPFGHPHPFKYIYLDFSLPKQGESKRFYVTYEFEQTGPPQIINCGAKYMHQKNSIMYPAVSASKFRQSGKISNFNFSGTETAIQVRSDNLHEDPPVWN